MPAQRAALALALMAAKAQAQPNVDECASVPCENGAACTDGSASYSCTCQPGFSGTNCANDLSECISSPCSYNGATCVDGPNSYTCSCVAGFAGEHCTTPTAEQLMEGHGPHASTCQSTAYQPRYRSSIAWGACMNGDTSPYPPPARDLSRVLPALSDCVTGATTCTSVVEEPGQPTVTVVTSTPYSFAQTVTLGMSHKELPARRLLPLAEGMANRSFVLPLCHADVPPNRTWDSTNCPVEDASYCTEFHALDQDCDGVLQLDELSRCTTLHDAPSWLFLAPKPYPVTVKGFASMMLDRQWARVYQSFGDRPLTLFDFLALQRVYKPALRHCGEALTHDFLRLARGTKGSGTGSSAFPLQPRPCPTSTALNGSATGCPFYWVFCELTLHGGGWALAYETSGLFQSGTAAQV